MANRLQVPPGEMCTLPRLRRAARRDVSRFARGRTSAWAVGIAWLAPPRAHLPTAFKSARRNGKERRTAFRSWASALVGGQARSARAVAADRTNRQSYPER
jgi:hypothetical protein